jgi:hypothetical protein
MVRVGPGRRLASATQTNPEHHWNELFANSGEVPAIVFHAGAGQRPNRVSAFIQRSSQISLTRRLQHLDCIPAEPSGQGKGRETCQSSDVICAEHFLKACASRPSVR